MSSSTGAIGGPLDGEGPSRVKVGYVTSVADWAGTEVVIRGGVSSCCIGLRLNLFIPEKASLK